MAANAYYAGHPAAASNQTLLHPNAAAQSIPYNQQPQAISPHNLSPATSPNLSPLPSPSLTPTSSTDRGRGFFSSSSDNENAGRKRSKSDRAIKFLEKRVQKQIDKKLNKQNEGGHGQEVEELLNQAFAQEQQDPTAAAGGDYGYGNTGDCGYGTGADYGAMAGGTGGTSGALSGTFGGGGGDAGGEYGFGDASAGYGPPGDFSGGGLDVGNFEWSGAEDAAEGAWGEIGTSIGEALGNA